MNSYKFKPQVLDIKAYVTYRNELEGILKTHHAEVQYYRCWEATVAIQVNRTCGCPPAPQSSTISKEREEKDLEHQPTTNSSLKKELLVYLWNSFCILQNIAI